MAAHSSDADRGAALARALPEAAREVEQFVGSAGWDQPPQLFALVPTDDLLASEPTLADQLTDAGPLTPVAQDSLPDGELDTALARIEWPPGVAGCALAQEIVVLPPQAADQLADRLADPDGAPRAAVEHPERREGRLVAAVLRDGLGACVLRLREPAEADGDAELLEHPDLAPNLLRALHATLT